MSLPRFRSDIEARRARALERESCRLDDEREIAISVGGQQHWLSCLAGELAKALVADYPVRRREAIIAIEQEIARHDDPISALEDLLLRHRIAARMDPCS